MEVGLLALHVVAGLTLAAHGAQKLFGAFGGPGIEGTAGFSTRSGCAPASFTPARLAERSSSAACCSSWGCSPRSRRRR
jgi:putative oxidoreductase